ncbi:MAG: hypothetical protein WCO75_08465 [Planctomycetota bacterium]
MTIAPPHPVTHRPYRDAHMAGLEIAWTISTEALDGHQSYGSAVLHLECSWEHERTRSKPDAAVEFTAIIDRAGMLTRVAIPPATLVIVERNERWTHIAITSNAGAPLLTASFEQGRLAYCTSAVPALARLRGGAYDAPTGILELYDAQLP